MMLRESRSGILGVQHDVTRAVVCATNRSKLRTINQVLNIDMNWWRARGRNKNNRISSNTNTPAGALAS